MVETAFNTQRHPRLIPRAWFKRGKKNEVSPLFKMWFCHNKGQFQVIFYLFFKKKNLLKPKREINWQTLARSSNPVLNSVLIGPTHHSFITISTLELSDPNCCIQTYNTQTHKSVLKELEYFTNSLLHLSSNFVVWNEMNNGFFLDIVGRFCPHAWCRTSPL